MSVETATELPGDRGVRLHARSWAPDPALPPRAGVVIVHGLGEHSGRYGAVAERLVSAGYAVDTLDLRGHGRSGGPRAIVDTATAVADVDRLVDRVSAANPGRPLFMLGHSLGGMIATAYAIAHVERLSGLALSGPLAVLDASPALQALARGLAAIAPRAGAIRLDPALVSRDPAVVAAYRSDPLVHHGRIPAATVAGISRTVASFPHAASAITVPSLILYGTADGLCPPRGAVMLAQRIGGGDVTVHAYPGLFHEVLNEPERETVLGDLIAWLDAHAPPTAHR